MRAAMTLLAGAVLAGGLMAVPADASGSGTVVELRNAATGMLLAIGSGERRKGKAAIQWPCKKRAAEQSWFIEVVG